MRELPFDGQLFFTIDLLLTTLVDTLALPVTAFLEPERPAEGFALGCRWAGEGLRGATRGGGR